MRRVPAGSFARLTDPVALWVAWTRCRAGRRRRADVARFDLDADRAVLALSRALRDGSWRPGTAAVRVVREPKARLIAVAPIPDRIVHQAVVGELGPHYARSAWLVMVVVMKL